MGCEEIKTRLSAWIDGEVPAGEAHNLEAHLVHCAPCAADAAELRSLKGVLAQSDELVPSVDFDARLWETLSAESPRTARPTSAGWRRWLVPTVATSGLALAGYFILLRFTVFTPPVYASGTLVCHLGGIKGACCVQPIEAQLRSFPEIESVKVDHSTRRVVMKIAAGQSVRLDKVARALKKCGGGSYDVKEFYVLPSMEGPKGGNR